LYRYVLEGADKAWSEPSDKSSTRNYFNLAPGHYKFRVSTRGFNGLWSKTEECSFIILPPWWKTWWAYILYVLIGTTVFSAYGRYRSHQLIQKNIELEDKIKQRTNELSTSLDNLKSTQAQLIQSEKMASLGELTAGIAHEIQNPLNFINNFSDVNSELIDELKTELTTGNTQQAIELANDIKENEQKINIIPQDIGRVILNLLTNAFYAVDEKKKAPQPPEGGVFYEPTVSLTTKKIGDKPDSYRVEIRVTDNGNGIPQKVLDKIFQPFFTTKPTGQGTGLGLSLSYDIVKAHGGEIKVETKKNEGTTFIINLPV
jgi:signal transduction histidine kinase